MPHSLEARQEVQPTHQSEGLDTTKWWLWVTVMPSTTASRMPLGRSKWGARDWLVGCLTILSLMSLPLMVQASRCQDSGSEFETEVYITQSGFSMSFESSPFPQPSTPSDHNWRNTVYFRAGKLPMLDLLRQGDIAQQDSAFVRECKYNLDYTLWGLCPEFAY